MNVRKLALISATAISLAFAGGALAQEQDQPQDPHHADAHCHLPDGLATGPRQATGGGHVGRLV